jgi:hypothetical protein
MPSTTHVQAYSQIGRAAGYGNLAAYTPLLFSKELQVKYYESVVAMDICNTNWEGEVKKVGDKVVIRTKPDVVIKDYVKGMKLEYDTPEPGEVSLTVDQAIYYATNIDDIDKLQNDIEYMSQITADGGQKMAIKVDQRILNTVYADAAISAANKGLTAGAISASYNMGTAAAPVALTNANILDYIVDAEAVLNEQNVPMEGRWMILPAWAYGLLEKSDLRSALFTGESGGNAVLRNGKAGSIGNFTIYTSNNLFGVSNGTTTNYSIMFGTKDAITFASQLTKEETLPNPDSFGTLFRALQCFGWEVIKGEAIGVLTAYKG